jgi:hypothetical protein
MESRSVATWAGVSGATESVAIIDFPPSIESRIALAPYHHASPHADTAASGGGTSDFTRPDRIAASWLAN